jgi:Flp pilus assembly protein CpaB
MTRASNYSIPDSPDTTPGWSGSGRRRAAIGFIAAVLLALLAGVSAFIYLDQIRQQSVPTGRAVVARQAVRPGQLLTADLVEVRPVPLGMLPTGALTQTSQAIGRTAIVPLAHGEVLLTDKVSGEAGGGLSARLPDGRWAMILPAGWLISPLPEVVAGDRLDLVAYQTGRPQAEAGVIVSAVEVLTIQGDAAAPDRLTLAVSKEEAVAIVYARANGLNLLALLRPQGG